MALQGPPGGWVGAGVYANFGEAFQDMPGDTEPISAVARWEVYRWLECLNHTWHWRFANILTFNFHVTTMPITVVVETKSTSPALK